MSHVTHGDTSCRTYAISRIHAHLSMNRVTHRYVCHHMMYVITHIDEMRHTNRYLMSRTWISRVTYMDETHTWMKHTHG